MSGKLKKLTFDPAVAQKKKIEKCSQRIFSSSFLSDAFYGSSDDKTLKLLHVTHWPTLLSCRATSHYSEAR